MFGCARQGVTPSTASVDWPDHDRQDQRRIATSRTYPVGAAGPPQARAPARCPPHGGGLFLPREPPIRGGEENRDALRVRARRSHRRERAVGGPGPGDGG